MNKKILDSVKRISEEKRKEALKTAINAQLVRDGIFDILKESSQCIVLYYPLEGESLKAFHVSKMIGKKSWHFVYINTEHEREKQAFAAAHELGHIWQIDRMVAEELGQDFSDAEKEEIINRFAAEFMMPERIFRKISREQAKGITTDGKIPIKDFLHMTVYLMYYFFQPFTAVIQRFLELGLISSGAFEKLVQINKEVPERIKNIIAEDQYSGIGVKDRTKSIKDIADSVRRAEMEETMTDASLAYLRKVFELGPGERGEGSEKISYGK